MRRSFAAAIFLCLFALFHPAHAQGGPDSIYVPGKGYVEKWQVSGVKQARHFGGYTASTSKRKRKAKSTKVAGKRFTPSPSVSWHSSGASWIAEARLYEGRNASQIGLSRRTLWCGTFVGYVAKRTGKPVPRNPHYARDWATVGSPSPGRIGDVAVMRRGKRGGHVGIVTGFDSRGNPILISGNYNNRVAEAVYPRARIIAFRSL